MKSLSRTAWLRLARWTIFGTLGCVLFSVGFTYIAFKDAADELLHLILLVAVILPILLAGPLFFYLSLKLRELAIVNHKLAIAASTDSMTGCLNRGAFAEKVERYFHTSPPKGSKLSRGALLVVDADHFKSINDRFGHSEGDEALQLIAAVISACVREGDVVGRLGGEEFGIFLPGATPVNAVDVAERMRRAVADTRFTPGGHMHALSISVGGAVFDAPSTFAELYRIADRFLYVAKEGGRNRVELSPLPHGGGLEQRQGYLQ